MLSLLHTSLENSHILWSFDPMSYLGANYLMVQLTVEQVDMGTKFVFRITCIDRFSSHNSSPSIFNDLGLLSLWQRRLCFW